MAKNSPFFQKIAKNCHFFQKIAITIQMVLFRRVRLLVHIGTPIEKWWKLILKVLKFVPFGANLPHYMTKSDNHAGNITLTNKAVELCMATWHAFCTEVQWPALMYIGTQWHASLYIGTKAKCERPNFLCVKRWSVIDSVSSTPECQVSAPNGLRCWTGY